VRTAIIHDWLVTYGGADRVLEQMLVCFPDAELFSLVDFLPPGERGFIFDKEVQTSFLQNLPFAAAWFRKCLPLLLLAVEQFDLSAYDLVISNSHSVAKGVITGPDQLHICYCHSPMRYAWDLQHQYLQEAGLDKGIAGWAARWMLHRGRIWDVRTANGVDEFIANSQFIARRIWKAYRREATVIYPPVEIDSFEVEEQKEDFYVTVARLVPYKKVNVIVEAFNRMPDKKLIVIGDGQGFAQLQSIAKPNISLLGFQKAGVLRQYLSRARAFLYAAEEDFGIGMVEAQACGTPVIAFGKGGALETVRDASLGDPTGLFFEGQTAEAVIRAVDIFEDGPGFDPVACRRNAERFSSQRFRKEFRDFCEGIIGRSAPKVASEGLVSHLAGNVE